MTIVEDMPEVLIARRLGLHQSRMRNIRKELDAEEWYRTGSGRNCRVMWKPSAIRKAEERLKVSILPPAMPKEEALRVVRTYPNGNRRLIQCQRENGEKVLVRVKDSSNYCPFLVGGKPMLVRAVPDGLCWTAVGRAPRYRGRW